MNELLIDRSQSVETWTLNRPRVRNALDRVMVEQLGEAVESAESTEADVVVLRGSGPSFCAGADLALLSNYDAGSSHTPREHLTAIWDLTLAMERSPVTFVAAVHGHAIAGGLELALACDIVVASRGTLIGDGHVLQCLLPGGGGSARMERAFGRSTATRLALTGEFLPAEHPAFGNWLHTVAEHDDFEASIAGVVESLADVPSTARSAYKRLLNETHGSLGTDDRNRELDAFDRHWLDNDVPQVLRAFLNKTRKASK